MLRLVLASLVMILPIFLSMFLDIINHLPLIFLLGIISKFFHCICIVACHFYCNGCFPRVIYFEVSYVPYVFMLYKVFITIIMVGSNALG